MKKISYTGYRFPPEIIQRAIWLYLRLSNRFQARPSFAANGDPLAACGKIYPVAAVGAGRDDAAA